MIVSSDKGSSSTSVTNGRAVYRIFAKGGELGSMSKRGRVRLFVAAGQPQGVGVSGNSRGARITQGGTNAPPCHPINTPLNGANSSIVGCIRGQNGAEGQQGTINVPTALQT